MFDPVGWPGLFEEAKALEPAELTAQARLAERLLQVDGGRYDDLEAAVREVWADMVLLQIAFQIEHSAALVHQGIGDLHQTFRNEGPISPEARIIRDWWFADGTEEALSEGSWGLDGIYDPDEE